MTGTLLVDRPWATTRRSRAVLSHAIRRMPGKPRLPTLDETLVARILASDDLPTPAESVDLLLLQIGEKERAPGEKAQIYLDMVRAAIGAQSSGGVIWAIAALHEAKLATGDMLAGPKQSVSLTFAGWQRYHELRRGSTDSRLIVVPGLLRRSGALEPA